MRFLLDNSLSPRMADGLRAAGEDATHVRDLDLASADDETIFESAAEANRILVAQDTDFGALLASRAAAQPSVILFRCRVKSVDALLPLLLSNLDQCRNDLDVGAIVVIEDARIRVRRLPLHGSTA